MKNMSFIRPFIRMAADDLKLKVNVFEEQLKKRDLRKYKIPKPSTTYGNYFGKQKKVLDATILVHQDDGRLLLTDRNGIYDKFIKERFKEDYGNILIIVVDRFGEDSQQYDTEHFDDDSEFFSSNFTTGKKNASTSLAGDPKPITGGLKIGKTHLEVPAKQTGGKRSQKSGGEGQKSRKSQEIDFSSPQKTIRSLLLDEEKIDVLADEGDQPFTKILSKHLKLFYVNEKFNFYQLQFFTKFLHEGLNRRPYHRDFYSYGLFPEQYDKQKREDENAVLLECLRTISQGSLSSETRPYFVPLMKRLGFYKSDLERTNCILV